MSIERWLWQTWYGITKVFPPCRGMEKITKTWREFHLNRTEDNFNSDTYNKLHLRLRFEESFYKQIEVVQAYGLQSLVGNGGKSWQIVMGSITKM